MSNYPKNAFRRGDFVTPLFGKRRGKGGNESPGDALLKTAFLSDPLPSNFYF